ncbi:MAG TPA: SGNH/GDSL hydrolase family protein [Fimbriimonadaceae bacterium]|nr:SGNH/GDSL hydrolase family protein [Fimbriimonadaceae bacterium]
MISSLLLALAMHPSSPPLPKLLEGVYRIVSMGDSITAANDPGHGYVAVLRSRLRALNPDQNFELINVGIGGQKAPDMLGRWDRDVIQKNPDLVTLSVGINDVWHGFYDNHPNGDGPKGVDIETYRSDVAKMVDSALAHHMKLVLVSPTVITEDATKLENRKLQGYVDAERQIARERHVPFVDLHATFVKRLSQLRTGPNDSTLHLTTDGVHMQPAGDNLMAYTILLGMGVPKEELTDLAPSG